MLRTAVLAVWLIRSLREARTIPGGIVITSETPVSKGGVQGSVQSFRGRMSQTARTAGF